MTRRDLGYDVQAHSVGILLVRQFDSGGELKDLQTLSPDVTRDRPIDNLLSVPLAAPDGTLTDLGSLSHAERIRAPSQIKRVDRQRAVTLQFTPPPNLALEDAVQTIETRIAALREAGAITPDVEV